MYRGEPDGSRGRLIYRGAEADVSLGRWCHVPAVYKVRKALPYRLEALDSMIRRQRTVHEAQMIRAARAAGVTAPRLYFVDQPRSTLVMEYVDGRRLKDLVSGMGRDEVARVFRLLGGAVARLHAAGLMHGDVTTANVIVRGGDLVFIDFGLSVHSARLEDQAVDMRLMKETISGAHPDVAGRATESLFAGYRDAAGSNRSDAVLRQLRQVERRGRYARVE